jgi:hypothetical protein
MTNLTPTPGWDPVPQLETNTKVLGGPGGPANAQAQALLDRTEVIAQGTAPAVGTLTGAEVLSASKAGSLVSATLNAITTWIENKFKADFQSGSTTYAVATGTANAHVIALNPALTARTDGMVIRYKVPAANTGALTLDDGLGPVAVVGSAHSALQGGETIANGDAWVQWNSSIGGGSYVMVDSTGGSLQIQAGTKTNQAVNYGQFPFSLSGGNGYTKLPNGIIFQWGSVVCGSDGLGTLVFPIAFPNNLFIIEVVYVISGTGVPTQAVTANDTSTSSRTQAVICVSQNGSGLNLANARIFAIGN